jgi:hypothetical protein
MACDPPRYPGGKARRRPLTKRNSRANRVRFRNPARHLRGARIAVYRLTRESRRWGKVSRTRASRPLRGKQALSLAGTRFAFWSRHHQGPKHCGAWWYRGRLQSVRVSLVPRPAFALFAGAVSVRASRNANPLNLASAAEPARRAFRFTREARRHRFQGPQLQVWAEGCAGPAWASPAFVATRCWLCRSRARPGGTGSCDRCRGSLQREPCCRP